MSLTQAQQYICANLSKQGWSVQDNFLTPELTQQLLIECQTYQSMDKLHPAGIGRATRHVIQKNIRGDRIHWLDMGTSSAVDEYLSRMEQLRLLLNQQLFLGLESSENHLAMYAPGTHYEKHLDRFRDDDHRTVSSVIYLNPNWKPEHGGELRLHLHDRRYDIAPIASRLVLFISADIWHEVLPTHAERFSVAGWFRRRTDKIGM